MPDFIFLCVPKVYELKRFTFHYVSTKSINYQLKKVIESFPTTLLRSSTIFQAMKKIFINNKINKKSIRTLMILIKSLSDTPKQFRHKITLEKHKKWRRAMKIYYVDFFLISDSMKGSERENKWYRWRNKNKKLF